MIVHFVEPEWDEEIDDLNYDNYHICVARTVKDYDRFFKFIKQLKNHMVVINKEWYTVLDYALDISWESEKEPLLKVFITKLY